MNAINFISGISMLGVFVGSASLIIILSVFNGFETLILSMYNTLTPEIRIEPATGKTFSPNSAIFRNLKVDNRVKAYTEVLQEKALIRYGKAQYIGLVKGVSEGFLKKDRLDSSIVNGQFTLINHGVFYAVIGSAVQANLGVNINDDFKDLEIYSPRKGSANSTNPADEFNVQFIHPSGIFSIQQQFDEMILVPISFARKLLDEEKNVSAIEIDVQPNQSTKELLEEISKKLGDQYVVKSRTQQNQLLYKILNSEKWAIFLILTFVLIIAIFNIIGSLTMLVIDKKRDIAILSSIGADNKLIRNIFFTEGMMISMIGCLAGMITGLIFCLLQQHYGFIKMNEETLIIDAYPISLKWTDFILVLLTVGFVSVIASYLSARLSVKNITQQRSF